MSIKCEKCGTENEDGAKFCKSCGTALNSEPVPVVELTNANKYKKPLLIAAGLLVLSITGYYAKIAVDEYHHTIGNEHKCNDNDAEACYGLAISYEFGTEGHGIFFSIQKDEQKQIQYFSKACDLGKLPGCVALGNIYSTGDIIKKDEYKAVELFNKAANGGDSWGYASLADAHVRGIGGLVQSTSKAKDLYAKGCDVGDEISKESCIRYSTYDPDPVVWDRNFWERFSTSMNTTL